MPIFGLFNQTATNTNLISYQYLFFLLNTEINTKILNTGTLLYNFRGLKYLQNKIGSETNIFMFCP